MDLERFGNAQDIVKLCMLRWLSPCGKWAADPMFTGEVKRIKATAFSRFLDATLVTIENFGEAHRKSARASYFAKAKSCPHHLLLDPNKGLMLPDSGRSRDHVMAGELLDIASTRRESLTLVYDQSINRAGGRGRKSQIKTKLECLEQDGLRGFAYVSNVVCFILVSRSDQVLCNAKHTLLQESRLPPDRLVD